MPVKVIFRVGSDVLEYAPSAFSGLTRQKRARQVPLTRGRSARIVSSNPDSMRKTAGLLEPEVSFIGVPRRFVDVLTRMREFEVDAAGDAPIELRTNVGPMEDGYPVELMPNSANVPSGHVARTEWYFPDYPLVSGTVLIYRDGEEIDPDDVSTPYEPCLPSGTVIFASPVASGVQITGSAEWCIRGHIDDMRVRSREGHNPPAFDVDVTFREVL